MNTIEKPDNEPGSFSVIDHAVTGESFTLHKHKEQDMWITSPIPGDLQRYYQTTDYLSHSDSGTTFFERLYQVVRKYRNKRKVAMLERRLGKAGSLLDIGTGTGAFAVEAKRRGWQVAGVEPNAMARTRAQEKNVPVAEHWTAYTGNTYDVITLWHVLEHLPELEQSVREIKKLLQPGGLLVVAVPNFNSWDARHYGSFWAGYDVPRHLWHFSRSAIASLFAKNELRLTETRPMHMDAFYVALLSEKYRYGKMRWLSAFGNAIWSNLRAMHTGEYSSCIYFLKNG